MRYLCLCYSDEEKVEEMGEEKLHALVDQQIACNEELRSRGRLLAAEALQSVNSATIVRVRNGRTSVTDGPFAETKEQVGGFFLIDAHDLNEAIRVASSFPTARIGSIEIRPVWDLHEQSRAVSARKSEAAEVGGGAAGSLSNETI